MKKIAFFVVFILFPTLLLAQSTITVVSNIKVTYDQDRGSYRWYRPVFAHEGSTLAADSSDFNEGDNFFDAYGHVVITQPNGTVVYADKLHYTEETQQALLTGNVRLVDQTSTLTTDYLTYNMKSKIGTYHGGGRIINGSDTLDSKNGYYFENSQDAYFRQEVIVRTSGALIKTDTMRYNSGSKMTYFYGPTNIFGKNGTLYTENGDYNTQSDRARFGKNNLYTEGSKFLKGDSLYYDGVSGNGRAVKNVVFVDTAQQIVMRGQLGTYNKATQTTIITENAYIVLAADEIKSDSTDSTLVKKDTLTSESLTPDSLAEDSLSTKPSIEEPELRKDSTFMTADTLFSQVIPLRDFVHLKLKLGLENDNLEEEYEEPEDNEGGDQIISREPISNDTSSVNDSIPSIQPDSVAKDSSILTADSLQTPSDSLKKDGLEDLKKTDTTSTPENQKLSKRELRKQEKIAKKKAEAKLAKKEKKSSADSLKSSSTDSIPKNPLLEKDIDSLKKDTLSTPKLALDSSMTVIPQGTGDSLLNEATKVALTAKTDSLNTDTGETRIVRAYHNVRIFKSDLQAIADSAYYGYADSIIRCYGKPIIWSQGSQLSADTVYMILKDQKMQNILFDKNAFIVNTQLDSIKFNQIKGRKITGYFKDNELNKVFVDGNAESIYYTVENNQYSGMVRSISSRIKIKFENKQMTDVISIRKAESTYYPIASIAPDKEILEGFIWKPELRPKSKEEIISNKPVAIDKKPSAESIELKEEDDATETEENQPIVDDDVSKIQTKQEDDLSEKKEELPTE